MKINDLRDLSPEELIKKREDLKEAHMNLRFQHATKQLERTSELRKVRRDIARVNTVLTEIERQN